MDDASNADPRFARSRLRGALWPALTRAFADAEAALVGVARRAHEASQVLAEVAERDLAAVSDGARLDVVRWRALGAARRANALRVWLQRVLGRGAPETLVERLLDELPRAKHARWPVGAEHQLALYRGGLQLAEVSNARPAPSANGAIDLSRPGMHALPQWGGKLEVSRAALGLPASALKACTLRAREGGEQFQRGDTRHAAQPEEAIPGGRHRGVGA